MNNSHENIVPSKRQVPSDAEAY